MLDRIDNELKILSAKLWTFDTGLFTVDAYSTFRLGMNKMKRMDYLKSIGRLWNRGILQESDELMKLLKVGSGALGKLTFVGGAAVSIYGAARDPSLKNWGLAGLDIAVGAIGLGATPIAAWAATVGLAIPGLNIIIAGGALACSTYRLYQAFKNDK